VRWYLRYALSYREVEELLRERGVGVRPGVNVRTAESLGLKLLQVLTEQLQGALTLAHDGSTAVTLTFPFPDGLAGEDPSGRDLHR
jgi:two-component sensor histidine kinase